MKKRLWLWLGVGLDLTLLLPALYFARAVTIAALNPESAARIGAAVLFAFLPIFCVAAPLSALNAWTKGRQTYALTILLAPLVYGAYLLVFLWPL